MLIPTHTTALLRTLSASFHSGFRLAESGSSLARESAHEGATLAAQVPGDAQSRPAVRVSQRDCRHGMRQLGQGRVKSLFVAAEMVLAADGTRLHSGEAAGTKQRCACSTFFSNSPPICWANFSRAACCCGFA